MYEPKPADPGEKPSGGFKCEETMEGLPPATQPFRELLDALTEEARKLAPPNDASTKFPDELKDVEKESQGIDAIVAKYKEFYDKQLDCKLADVKRWRAKFDEWTSTLKEDVKTCIKNYRKEKYDKKEETICCNWVKLRRELNQLGDPLTQAKNKEALKQDAYDKLKGFLDAVTKVFTDLEALFKKADAFNKEEKPKSVYAVSLEFEDLYCLLDWPKTDEEKCSAPKGTGGEQSQQATTSTGGGQQQYATTQSGGEYGQSQEQSSGGSSEGPGGCSIDPEKLKKKLTSAEFRLRLFCALRGLVLAKFSRMKIHHQQLKAAAELEAKQKAVDAAKKECDQFRADRQKLFLDLAEDIPCETGGGGGGGQSSGGGYGQQQPPGGGQQQQPPSGGYGKPPQAQGKPTGGYDTNSAV